MAFNALKKSLARYTFKRSNSTNSQRDLLVQDKFNTKHEESNISKIPFDNKNQDSKNSTEKTKPDIVSHFFPADHINKHVIPYSLIPTLTKEEKKILEHNLMCMRVKEYYGIDIS